MSKSEVEQEGPFLLANHVHGHIDEEHSQADKLSHRLV